MDLHKLWENQKPHYSHWASIGQAQTSWVGSPRVKTGNQDLRVAEWQRRPFSTADNGEGGGEEATSTTVAH
jgi:hypothetical protein